MMNAFSKIVWETGSRAAVPALLVAFGVVSADAGPVVREASGVNAAAIQAAVDAFRADLGNPNNQATPGSQPAGRREINWDGANPAAPPTITGSPMTNFAARGSTFFTPGSGFEISGTPSAELSDINAGYLPIFAPFSSPRIFTALNSNVTDVVFHVPGDAATLAATTGFGAVFTDVDTSTSTKLEFYAPDGTLLYERFVLAGAGSEYLSFLGVSFNAGELVGRVRIISGNAALGPDETGSLDLVAMDDFLFGEPVATEGLLITPASTTLFQTGGFDLVLGLEGLTGAVVGGAVRLDGVDVTQAFLSCMQPGTSVSGGQTLRCPIPGGLLSPGDHVLQVDITLSNLTRVRNAVKWTVQGNTEP